MLRKYHQTTSYVFIASKPGIFNIIAPLNTTGIDLEIRPSKKDQGKNAFASVAIKEVTLLSIAEQTGKKLTVDYLQDGLYQKNKEGMCQNYLA